MQIFPCSLRIIKRLVIMKCLLYSRDCCASQILTHLSLITHRLFPWSVIQMKKLRHIELGNHQRGSVRVTGEGQNLRHLTRVFLTNPLPATHWCPLPSAPCHTHTQFLTSGWISPLCLLKKDSHVGFQLPWILITWVLTSGNCRLLTLGSGVLPSFIWLMVVRVRAEK